MLINVWVSVPNSDLIGLGVQPGNWDMKSSQEILIAGNPEKNWPGFQMSLAGW